MFFCSFSNRTFSALSARVSFSFLLDEGNDHLLFFFDAAVPLGSSSSGAEAEAAGSEAVGRVSKEPFTLLVFNSAIQFDNDSNWDDHVHGRIRIRMRIRFIACVRCCWRC